MDKDKTWFKTVELANNLYVIAEHEHAEEINSFLLLGDDFNFLIDTGMGLFSMKKCVQNISNKPVKVLNTHSHFDHVGSNVEFSDIFMFEHKDNKKAAKNGFSEEYLSKWASNKHFRSGVYKNIPKPYTIPAFPNAKFFDNNAVFQNTNFSLQVIHTPGHSDDSVCFYEEKLGWLFAGDLLYDGAIYIEKVGGLRKFKNSIERISKLRKLNRIFSSHNAFELSIELFSELQEVLNKISDTELNSIVSITDKLKLEPF
jgi:glyoxylase-like metal-dependent hydrolase (beta-lactamase superfamily II)